MTCPIACFPTEMRAVAKADQRNTDWRCNRDFTGRNVGLLRQNQCDELIFSGGVIAESHMAAETNRVSWNFLRWKGFCSCELIEEMSSQRLVAVLKAFGQLFEDRHRLLGDHDIGRRRMFGHVKAPLRAMR